METQITTVLVVEDDQDDYFLARGVLDSIDRVAYESSWCDTFDKALDALTERSFDVALIDYRIGGETGIDFVKTAKADGIDVPMILLTGLQEREIDIAASEAGAVDYLNKHELTPAVVERSIRFACANAATQRRLAEQSSILQSTLDSIVKHLFGASIESSSRAMQPKDRREEIKEAQGLLNFLGYDAGNVDGIIGSKTTSAARAFQRERAMVTDGKVDRVLAQRLRKECKIG